MARIVYVPELGRSFTFQDGASDQEVASYFSNYKIPERTAVAPPAPKDQSDGSNLLENFAYQAARGITDIPGGIAALVNPAERAAKTPAGRLSEGSRQWLEEKLGIDPTKERTVPQMAAGALGSVASFLVPGGIASKGARLVGAGEELATRVAAGVAGAQGVTLGAEQRAETIREQLKSGMNISEEDQLAAQRLDGLIGASEMLPLNKFFGPLATILEKVPVSKAPVVEKLIKSRLAKIGKAGLDEGAQEFAQNLANDLVEYGVYNPNVQIGQGMLSNFGTGAFAGGFTEGVIQLALGRKVRPYRQLQADLQSEGRENLQLMRQGKVTQAAEALRQNNVQGIVGVQEEEVDGLPVFSVKTPDGKTVAQFDGELGREFATSAVNLYKKNTGAEVSIRGDENAPDVFPVEVNGKKFSNIADINNAKNDLVNKRKAVAQYIENPSMLKAQAATKEVSEDFYKSAVLKHLENIDGQIKSYDDFLNLATGKKPIIPPGEAPVEAPKLEPTKEISLKKEPKPKKGKAPKAPLAEIAAAAENPVKAETEVVTPAIELRPSATAEQLDDLKKELFGGPISIRDMTPEQKARYESERDSRYPPVPTTKLSAAEVPQTGKVAPPPAQPTPGAGSPAEDVAPKSLREAYAMGPKVRAYTPEVTDKFKKVYDGLISRMKSIAPPEFELNLKDFIDAAGPNVLVKGAYSLEKKGSSTKNIVDLATGIYDPSLTSQQLLDKLMEVTNHELIHALRNNGLIREGEWRILAKAVETTKVPGKKYTYLDKASTIYTSQMGEAYANEDAVREEAVAEMYKDWVKNQKAPVQTRGLFNRITEFFRRLFNVLRDTKYETVFKQIETGDVGKRTPDTSKSSSGTKFSAAPAVSTEAFQKWFKNSKVVDERGRPLVVFHGTKADFTVFDRSRGNVEGDMGAGFYFSNTPADVEKNYATEGPDLKNKIEVLANNLIDDVADETGKDYNDPEVHEEARRRARDKFATNEGVTVPAYLSIQNPVIIGGDKETIFNIDFDYNEETEEYGDPKGSLQDIVDAVREVGSTGGLVDYDVDEIVQKLYEMGDSVMASELVNLLKDTSVNMINDNGDLAGNEFIRQVFEEAGYDGVIDNLVNIKFGSQRAYGKGMDGMRVGTTHYIAFKPEQIKSAIGNVGTFDPQNPDIRFSAAPAIDSDEFKKWFAGSQMVDRAGRPIVVYTGTSKDKIFNSFKENDRGTWVTTSPETASQYAMDNDSKGLKMGPGWTFEEVNTASRVIPLYVSAKKILDLTGEKAYADFARDNGVSDTIDYRKAQSQIGRAAKSKGYDAIKWGPDVWSVFDAKNLKSTMNSFEPGTAESKKFSASPVVGSEEFNRWFKDSKAVDEAGNPKVYYHGTPKSFKEFGKARSANWRGEAGQEGPFFFAEDPKFADQYALMKIHAGGDGRGVRSGSKVYPVYLSVQNPFDYENPEHLDRLATELGEGYSSSKYSIRDFSDGKFGDGVEINGYRGKWGNEAEKEFVKQNLINLRDAGRDGDWTVLENLAAQKAIRNLGFDGFYVNEMGFKNLAVYNPTQVKSIFNPFEEGAAESRRFSAAPIPADLESKNETLFAKAPKTTFKDMVFNFFLGETPGDMVLNTVHGPKSISKITKGLLISRAAIVDKGAFVNHLEKMANKEATGNFERMSADYSATAALAWRQRASQITASMIMKGKIGISFDRPGDIQSATIKVDNDDNSLLEIFRVMSEEGPADPKTGEPRNKGELFKMYATAQRAIGLKADGQPVPKELDNKYINDTISFVEKNYPEVVEAYKKYQNFNKNLLTAAADAGVISKDALANLTKRMNYYGYYREAYEDITAPTSSTKTASQFKLREYRGSEKGGLVNDPMFVMLQNANFWVDSIAKNLATTKAFKLANGMGVARILNTGEDPKPENGEERQPMFFREDGVQKRFAVSDPLLVTALGSDDRVDLGRFWQLMGKPAGFLRESVTRDPGFMVANLARDTLSAWITSGADITPFISTIRGFTKAYKNESSFQALMGRGVVGSYDLAMLEPAELAKKIRREVMPKNIHTIHTVEGATAVVTTLWSKLGHLSEMSDAATRIAIYDAAIKDGATDAEAAFRAIEVMDFSRRGGSGALQVLTKVIPFLNARIQGLDVLYQAGAAGARVATGNARGDRDMMLGKKFLIRGGMLAALSMALEMINEDDDDYKQLDDYIKNGNLLIPLKHFGLPGEFIAIPKPFEAGLLFSTFPQQFYKTLRGDASARDNMQLFVGSIGSTFGINPIPQAAAPIAEVFFNKDLYTGLPLISEGKLRLSPELQYNTRTSTVARMLGEVPWIYNTSTGKFEGMSPIAIDNIISGYSGPLGTYMLEIISSSMAAMDAGPEQLPKISVTDQPVVKRFFIDAESKNPKVVTQAYELFKIADEANRTFSRLRQMGDAEAIADYVNENKEILGYRKYIFKLTDRLNKLSAYERQIAVDRTMSDADKIEAIKNLRQTRIKIAAAVETINKKLGR